MLTGKHLDTLREVFASVGDQPKALIERETRGPTMSGKCGCLRSCRGEGEPERGVPHEVQSLSGQRALCEHVFGYRNLNSGPEERSASRM